MTPEEQYTRILQKGRDQEIMPFMKGLQPDERKALVPAVKRLAREYMTYQQQGNAWRPKADEKQTRIIHYAYFFFYNRKEFEKTNVTWLLSREYLEQFLPWYVPDWLGDYINSFAERGWLPHLLDYGYLLELEARIGFRAAPQLVARLMVPYVFEYKDQQYHFAPQRLLLHGVTLEEHVWHLFQYETTLHTSNRHLYRDGKQVEQGWLDVFRYLLDTGRLDKGRLLQEALLASNRNFSKNLSGWFAELFLQLKPEAADILPLQAELFNLFAAPHGKVVTTALQACKAIVDSPRFDTEAFLDGVPLLLASSTKTVVATALQLLEKTGKKQSGLWTRVCRLATGAFVHKDEGLQTRAARLIQKTGDPGDEDLKATLALYGTALFSGARELLLPYLTLAEAPEAAAPPTAMAMTRGPLTDDTALPPVNTVDELIFLTAQAFDNNESWHLDALPAALIRLQDQINGSHLPKFEPAIQRALKFYFGDWRSGQGDLDQLLACFFLDYCLWLIEQYPQEGNTARELFRTYMARSGENIKVWEAHGTRTTFLGGWKPEGRRFLYTAYRKLLESVLFGLKHRLALPLLCAPTHAPAWIDPAVLVERLALHQGGPIDDTDLQIALSRCWLHGTEGAVQLASGLLRGELRALMLFLLDKDTGPAGPFHAETAWMAAALSKSPGTVYPALADLAYSRKPRALYTGQYPYAILSETYTYDDYDWKGGRQVTIKKTGLRKVIRLDLSAQQEQKPKEGKGLKGLFHKLTGKAPEKAPELPPLLYDYLRFKDRWMHLEDRDISRLYGLTPNNPEPVLALTIDWCLSEPEIYGETTKRFTIHVLEALLQTWRPSGATGHLFVACCLLSPDKTTATYAAEIWLRGVEGAGIDSGLLGTLLGRFGRIEFAPLKRFTDLAVRSLLNNSPQHNRALEVLLAALLVELPPTPVKGLKKLLEIYFEVLRHNRSAVTDKALKALLEQWKEQSGWSKVFREAV